MAHIAEAIRSLRHDDPSHALAGKRFEFVVRDALKSHPGEYGRDRFEDVWLWQNWPDREARGYSRQDTGIDLVARQRVAWGGGFCAIQCKYGKSKTKTSEIDSFLADSDGADFKARMLITSRDIPKIGYQKLEKADPRCHVLHTAEMDDWVDDWRPSFDAARLVDPVDLPKHTPWAHQRQALEKIQAGFTSSDRGKLILPCGTGKSFVALRAAEQEAGLGSTVLYLVPSIALMGQTMREWSRQRTLDLRYLGVCSDSTTARKTGEASGTVGNLTELAMPVTTDPDRLAKELAQPVPGGAMRVVFSTYQSTSKIATALEALPGFRFDLVICDEAHRTTGVPDRSKVKGYEGVSPFLLVHRDDYLPAAKRLFMTATPRVFTKRLKKKLESEGFDGDSYSMDDEAKYGPEFFRMSFAEALDANCLSDYEVLVIVASEAAYQQSVVGTKAARADSDVSLDSAVKLAGCWDALATPHSVAKVGTRPAGKIDTAQGKVPARSAIAFCNTVKKSKLVAEHWDKIGSAMTLKHPAGERKGFLVLDVSHIDGGTPAHERARQLHLLREHAAIPYRPHESPTPTTCRVLTNAQVLSEGVDVPALDAVVFLEPRRSEIDITQAVGRAMRKAEGKIKGYIVIPVVVPDFGEGEVDERARTILKEGDFSPVWQVARALRSHDDRIDYWLNNPRAVQKKSPFRLSTRLSGNNGGSRSISDAVQTELALALNDQFASMVVDSVGDKHMYPRWGQKAASICKTVRRKIDHLVASSPAAQTALHAFAGSLRDSVDPAVTDETTIQMVAQHVVTIPVFRVMFAESEFARRNPISRSIDRLLADFAKEGVAFDEDLRPLNRAYRTMERAFDGAVSGSEKLDILREIYDGFFAAAMKNEVKSLGIAYTPIPLVDFMLRSVNAVCKDQFGRGLTDEGVTILDPFVGTGTFVNRLLTARDAKGEYLIRDEDLERKYRHEIWANEIVLLAYYIAALTIEEARYDRLQSKDRAKGRAGMVPYEPFNRILLTDTFLMTEHSARRQFEFFEGIDENYERQEEQNRKPIWVVVGNPPWSAGQKRASDDNPNREYPDLSARVADTYGFWNKKVKGQGLGKAAGNLYVKACRWASDRVDMPAEVKDGPAVVALVTPNSFADAPSLTGMRAAVRDEFTDIYVVNLRGNAYKSGEERRKEGDPIFGVATRNGVQITVLVRNPDRKLAAPATLHYAEVPERYTREQKFQWLAQLGDVLSDHFKVVPVNQRHDWMNLGDETFFELLPLARPKKEDTPAAVRRHAIGLTTACDAYVYSFSRDALCKKVSALIDEFNRTLAEWRGTGFDKAALDSLTQNTRIDVIKWTGVLKSSLKRKQPLAFDEAKIREVLYRPFTKLWLYEDARILSSVKTISRMFAKASGIAPPPPENPTTPPPARGGRTSGFSSHPPPTEPSSRASPPHSSRTSTPWTQPEERPPGDPDHGDQQHDLSGPGDRKDAGSGRDQGLATDAGAAPASDVGAPHSPPPPPPRKSRVLGRAWGKGRRREAILVNQTQQLPFATLATDTLFDLCATGRQTRAIPRS